MTSQHGNYLSIPSSVDILMIICFIPITIVQRSFSLAMINPRVRNASVSIAMTARCAILMPMSPIVSNPRISKKPAYHPREHHSLRKQSSNVFSHWDTRTVPSAISSPPHTTFEDDTWVPLVIFFRPSVILLSPIFPSNHMPHTQDYLSLGFFAVLPVVGMYPHVR